MSNNKDFDKGAKAMFDYVTYAVANHFHGDPDIQKIMDIENEFAISLIEDALDDVSPDIYTRSFNKHKILKLSLNKLSLAFNDFIDACITETDQPQVPSKKAINKARAYLPPYCKHSYGKPK